MSDPLYVAITVDVEEEGLFSGRYPREGAGVANVAQLERLAFIPREFGFPLTLLVTYPVARDAAAREVLLRWHQDLGAEIGVHLHPWNTPPFADLAVPEPVPTARLPLSLLEDKLATLIHCVSEGFRRPPRSFRMGRFDWSWELLALLPRFGLRVDTSMVPLSLWGPGLENFCAPFDPFWPALPGTPPGQLLEVPVTMVPVWPASARVLPRLAAFLPGKLGRILLSRYRYVAAAGVHPAWFPAFSLRLAAALHRRRGGRVLTVFLHSSELYPGGSPDFPDQGAVERLVAKLRHFLSWLVKRGPVQGVTLSELHDLLRPAADQ